MANPTVKIKRIFEDNVYAENPNLSSGTYKLLNTLEEGELAFNKFDNGLYIGGQNGEKYLLSVTNSNGTIAQTFYGSVIGNVTGSSTKSNQIYSAKKNPTSATTYYMPFHLNNTTGYKDVLNNDGMRISLLEGTASADGYNIFILGNGTSTGTAGNKYGKIRLYSAKTAYHDIAPSNVTTNVTHTLPSTGGTILNSGTTSFAQVLTSGTKIGTIKINGTSTDIFAPTNTDKNVSQTKTTTTSYRAILFSNDYSDTVSDLDTSVTGGVYKNSKIYASPGNGAIYATSFHGTADNVPWSGVTGKPTYYDAKAIKSITRSGTTFTYTCLDGTTGTFTQQDNNTTYTVFGASGSGAKSGLVPAPSTTAGTTKYLREDGTWQTPPNTNTKVNVTLATTTKAYLLGTSTTPTSTAQGVTAIADTGVYLDTTAGKLVATSFSGNGANLTNLNAGNISSGTLPIARGGTGGTAAKAAEYNILNGMVETDVVPTDDYNMVFRYTNPSTTQGALLYRKTSTMWEYIKGKLTGAISNNLTSNLSSSRALISDANGKITVSAVTSTELGYLDGVTSAIQTQLNNKLNLSGGTIAGNLTIDGLLSTYSIKARTYDLKVKATGGWYRIYTNPNGNANGTGSCVFLLGRSYNSPQNEEYVFSVSVGYNGQISINQLSGCIGGHLISKIRIVYKNSSPFYIDFYTGASSYDNTYKVYGFGPGVFQAPVIVDTVEEEYNTYEFTTVNGCKSDKGFEGNLSGQASHIKMNLTNPSSGTYYYPIWVGGISNGSSQAVRANDGFAYSTQEGTTSVVGYGNLILGNNKATGTAGNKYGQIALYGKKTYYNNIIPNETQTAHSDIYLPAGSGTLARTIDNVASADVASKIADLHSGDTASSTATQRYVWFSYNDNLTGRPAYSANFTYQSSTGTVTATIFKGALSGNASSASNLSGVNTTLSTGVESSAITIKSNNNGSLGSNNLALRNAIDFKWYNTHWQIGNLRGGSTDSAGFGFAYSADGSTYSLKAKIDTSGNITATSFIGSLTGHATSATYLTGWADNRNVNTTPNTYNNVFLVSGLKYNANINSPDSSTYSGVIGFRSWSDSSGGNSHELAFTGNGNIYHRHGATTSWNSWNRLLNSSDVTGAVSTILTSNLTANRALISNSSGKVDVSAVTSTELGYLDGVTSAIQTQLNNKMESVKTKSITVTGDANTYYPVVIETTASKSQPNYISVWKNLGSTTNSSYSGNHSNGTSSFWIMYELRNQLWDGNGGYCKTLYHVMSYATLCARAQMLGSAVGHLCLWLRGGTTTYEISAIGTSAPTVNVYYSNTNLGSSTYPVNVGPETAIGNKGIITTNYFGYGDLNGNANGAYYLLDKSNSTATYVNYSASGLSTTSWFAAWNGYELRAISPSATLSTIGALPLAGGTMTGQITMASTGWKTNSSSGYVVDQYGNFTHLTTTTTNNFNVFSNNQSKYFKVWFETGNVETTGSITATGAITSSNRLISNAQSNTTNPTQQSLVLNGVTGSSDTALAPGIGFHIGNLNYATLKFLSDGSFRFYNNGCTSYQPVYVGNLTATGTITCGNYFSVNPSTNNGGLAYKGRFDVGCICLTNTNWTGYGTSDPTTAGLDKVTGRVYFKLI